MTLPVTPAATPVATQPVRPTAGSIVAAVAVGLVATVAAVLTAGGEWVAVQVGVLTGADVPWWVHPLTGVTLAVPVVAGAWPLAVFPRAPAIRAAGRAWLVAGLAAAALTALRAIPQAHHELYLAAFALVAALIGVRRNPPSPHLPGIAAGLLVALPWLWVGALGGVTETLLALLAAAAAGRLAARVLGGPEPWRLFSTSPAALLLGGGTVAAVALALLAAGTGHTGPDVALLFVLPPLGYVLAALYALAVRSRLTAVPAAWVVALAVAGPLALVDPDEISVVLATDRDVPAWTALAAGASWLLAALTAVAYGIRLGRRRASVPHRRTALITTAVVALAAAVVYAGPGQPGLYGERLFVVMSARTDLTGVTGTRDARVAEVYRRLVATARDSQAGLRRDLDRWNLPYTPYYLVNGVEVSGGPEVRAWLAGRDDVARVLLSPRLRPLPALPGVARGELAGPPDRPPWGLAAIGADRVVRELGVTGAGITVGSSDSGADGTHPALAPGFRGGDDSWLDPWNRTATPADRNGHGTHTLGTAVGREGVGVAPGASWVGCVNLARNLGNPARYLDCLQFMLAPYPAGGDPFADGRPARAPHVLANSWGCPELEGCDPGALTPALAALDAAGIMFVAAAGNEGPRCGSLDTPPAPDPNALTVGATADDGTVASFSSRGGGPGKPDVVAPGAEVVSAMPGGTYGSLDGTSMAAPHVAGVVALLWSAQPALIGDLPRTRQLLRDTAKPVTAECAASGAGLVDAYAAVTAARALR